MTYAGITDHDHVKQVNETEAKHDRWKRDSGVIRGRVTTFATRLGDEFPDNLNTIAEQLEAAARELRERARSRR